MYLIRHTFECLYQITSVKNLQQKSKFKNNKRYINLNVLILINHANTLLHKKRYIESIKSIENRLLKVQITIWKSKNGKLTL